jgi:hypothetical protein
MEQSQVSAGKHVSLWGFLVTIALVMVGFVYLLKTAYARDPLWFWPVFEEKPTQVVVKCHGDIIILGSSVPDTQNIASLVNQQLSRKKRFDPLNLTDPTFVYYQTDPSVVTLELIYPNPVRIHQASMYFSNITSIMIPLEGRYANSATIFGLIDNHPTGGALHMQTNQPLVDYLSKTGLCEIQ